MLLTGMCREGMNEATAPDIQGSMCRPKSEITKSAFIKIL